MLVQLVLLVKGLPAVGAEKVLYPRVDPPQMAVEVPLLEEGRLAHGALERPQVVVVDHVVLELGRGEEVLVADITVMRLVAALLAPRVLALLVLLEVDQLVEALLAAAFQSPQSLLADHRIVAAARKQDSQHRPEDFP